jgi:hypothetical protein
MTGSTHSQRAWSIARRRISKWLDSVGQSSRNASMAGGLDSSRLARRATRQLTVRGGSTRVLINVVALLTLLAMATWFIGPLAVTAANTNNLVDTSQIESPAVVLSSEIWLVFALIVCVLTLASAILLLYRRAKAPNAMQDQRTRLLTRFAVVGNVVNAVLVCLVLVFNAFSLS